MTEEDLLNCPNCGRHSDCEENCASRKDVCVSDLIRMRQEDELT